MSGQPASKRYLIWGMTVSQPNVVEKVAGVIRRSPTLYQLVRLYYGPSGEDGRSIFYVEIASSEKGARRLVEIYKKSVEVLEVHCRQLPSPDSQ